MHEHSPALATAPAQTLRKRELATISAMLRMYCRAHHGRSAATESGLCPECSAVRAYAWRRLERCVFAEDKPTCVKCKVHCYSAAMRERVRRVMRWAGPRLLLRHPLLALHHWLAGRRAAPELPSGPRRGGKTG